MKSLSHVQLFATPWTIAYQAPPSMEFSRQEYWGRLPFPSPEDLSDTGIEARSPTLQADAYHLSHQGKSTVTSGCSNKFIFGCAGCFLQYTGFPSCGKWGLLSSCGAWASHCAGYSCCSPSSSAGKESTGNAGDLSLIPGSERSSGEGIGYPLQYSWASLVAQLVKNLPAVRETWI